MGEAALVFETAAGRRTAIDFDTQRASGDVHAELWIDGERIQTAQAVAGTYSYAPLYPAELDPTEAEVLSAGLILLSRRFAAAGCADCCEGARRLAAPLAAAHDLLRACLAGGVCCD